MTRQIEGLWIGGAMSVEAAEIVEEFTLAAATRRAPTPDKVRTELMDLANAIRAMIQKSVPSVPEPKPDLTRYL